MKQQRPATARSVSDGLKLHRHLLRSPGRVHTVITLRPGTRAGFSTNRYHDTWHVLSDDHGARLLARLLWGLSYQARPHTVVLVDRPFLRPNPFDAEPADPIVLVPGWCTPFDDRIARSLKNRLPLSNPDGTVRWHTFGLDRTLRPAVRETRWDRSRRREDRGSVRRRSGLLVLRPRTPDEARAWALDAAGLDTTGGYGSDYTYLGPWDYGYDGEIQIFRRFHPMVSVANQARAQVLSREDAPADPESLRCAVWREAETVRGDAHLRIREWRSGGWELGREAAAVLVHADVNTLDGLAAVGSVEAYRRLHAARVRGLTLDMLWAMEAALTYRDRRSVSTARRRELFEALGDLPAPATPERRRSSRPPRLPTRRARLPAAR
ncbi:TfoX/Sxy family DNA transformation protein [Nocardia otitidiscaviarum]|uniref:TfoX/Sxy family DNA transformation protein n=1 Tax=Nocardia otitidiscaviarum TaxID=1823 RepID=UPI00069325CC|nr:TfoX/Sxy family DNA transformation protein [Nocardia otitidiscaviarum]MBF6132600.1 TfoX/Sxy family DNA transformation protein [Nocardia otitidiscaviarum]MBF6488701.1 TfoX/Sxy family DNA transformation protein [Nocardia otitidiscaviarum]